MLAGREDLAADGDDAVGGHLARHPVVARAFDGDRRVQGQVGVDGASAEALEGTGHVELLVRPFGVVVVHPLVELDLEVL